MNDAVFISDLHLNPDCPNITEKFLKFCQWAESQTRSIYILGDFFHLWIGDDDQSSWIEPICNALRDLHQKGIKLFYMGGNRDFLLGKQFCRRSQMQYMPDATILQWEGKRIAITHGDRLCSKDKSHQLFYRFTRNIIFRFLFNRLPFKTRQTLAERIRQRSQHNKAQQLTLGYVTFDGMKQFLHKYPCEMVIHGHTHQPALHHHVIGDRIISRFVLSDWDDKVAALCYHRTKGFYFHRF